MRARQLPLSLSFFLSDWAASEAFMNELEERCQNAVWWSQSEFSSVMVWLCLPCKPHPRQGGQLHQRKSGSFSKSHHKPRGGQAGAQGCRDARGLVPDSGQHGAGRPDRQPCSFHQHLSTELSPCTRHTQRAARNSDGADVSPVLKMLRAWFGVQIARRGHSTASATHHCQSYEWQERAEKMSET